MIAGTAVFNTEGRRLKKLMQILKSVHEERTMIFAKLRFIAAAYLAIVLLAPTAVWAQDAKRAITQIAGDLYRFQNNFHFSVFLVTPAGVIATDPISTEAAT